MTSKKKLGLTPRILIGMALGILVGALFKFLLAGEAERTLSLFGAELGLRAFFVDGIFHAGGFLQNIFHPAICCVYRSFL